MMDYIYDAGTLLVPFVFVILVVVQIANNPKHVQSFVNDLPPTIFGYMLFLAGFRNIVFFGMAVVGLSRLRNLTFTLVK